MVAREAWRFWVGSDENGVSLEPFPIDISGAEAERIDEEAARRAGEACACDELLEHLSISPDHEGLVDAEQYEAAKRAVELAKHAALDAALTQEEKDLIEKAWPLQDGKVSLTAEVCC